MKPPIALVIAGLLTALSLQARAEGGLAFVNGRVYTGVAGESRAEAVLAVGGRIAYVGDSAEVRRRAPEGARVIDLQGATVLPGLTDAHAHLAGIGLREISFDVTGVAGVAELQARL